VTPFLQTNILYGTQLLEAMRLSGCRRFVTAESILQYSETGAYRPFNLYSATKQAFADLLHYYVDAFDLAARALVLPTIYSEYESTPKLMTDTTYAIQHGTVLHIQTEDVLIDFVHVEDVADAFVRACSLLENDAAQGSGSFHRYCVSSGAQITPPELFAVFERVGERRLRVQKGISSNTSRRVRPWSGPVVPGWTPRVDLETGVRRMLSIRS
jgi:nucleoside-diphosphate-sugar epimerase